MSDFYIEDENIDFEIVDPGINFTVGGASAVFSIPNPPGVGFTVGNTPGVNVTIISEILQYQITNADLVFTIGGGGGGGGGSLYFGGYF